MEIKLTANGKESYDILYDSIIAWFRERPKQEVSKIYFSISYRNEKIYLYDDIGFAIVLLLAKYTDFIEQIKHYANINEYNYIK